LANRADAPPEEALPGPWRRQLGYPADKPTVNSGAGIFASEIRMNRDMRPEGPRAAAPPRLWTVDEANARIETLGELLDEMREWAARRSRVHLELKRLGDFWGAELDAPDHADHHLKERLEAESRNLSRRLDEAIASLRAEAIEVKELGDGLVDFYSVQDGELSFLCWRRGEPSVGFFHPLAGGFRNRRPIPDRAPPATSRPRTPPS
jgi:hypothetical protein